MASKYIILAALFMGIYTALTWAILFGFILAGYTIVEPDQAVAGAELLVAVFLTLLSITAFALWLQKLLLKRR
jgi:hypothetical protein